MNVACLKGSFCLPEANLRGSHQRLQILNLLTAAPIAQSFDRHELRNEKEFRRDGEIETPNRLNSSKTSSKEIMDKIRYVVWIFDFMHGLASDLNFHS